jgi:hypothetical protein
MSNVEEEGREVRVGVGLRGLRFVDMQRTTNEIDLSVCVCVCVCWWAGEKDVRR